MKRGNDQKKIPAQNIVASFKSEDAAAGAGVGTLVGKLTDYGIDDEFLKSLGEQMKPGSSAIFVLARKVAPDAVIAEMSSLGGTVLRASLSKDAEARLQLDPSEGTP
jgi:uncharacterized membrane protein